MDLTPSHVAFTAILLELVRSGRKVPEAVVFDDVMGPMSVLCFLGDRVSLQHCHQYGSANDLMDELLTYFHGTETSVQNGTKFQSKVMSELSRLQTVDHMIDFVDVMNTIFDADPTVSPNEVMAPTRICTDSSLGIFARSFIAKWNCMSFDMVCCLHESMVAFVSSSRNGSSDGNGTIIHSSSSSPSSSSSNLSIVRPKAHQCLIDADAAASRGDVLTAEKLLHNYFDLNGGIGDPLLQLYTKSGNTSHQLALHSLIHPTSHKYTLSHTSYTHTYIHTLQVHCSHQCSLWNYYVMLAMNLILVVPDISKHC